ncbi:hypothetical protein, partial [Enterobacter hormaechei]|uniref:hypothetical protein n=1 Tax=Enterobacter hormaechei TaxID=158836 RepID=UPI00203FE936
RVIVNSFKNGHKKATPLEWLRMEDKLFREKLVAGLAVATVHCQVMSAELACRSGNVVIAAE